MLWVKGYCEWEKVPTLPHPAPIDHGARGAILPTIYHIYTAGVRTTRDLTPYDSIIVTSSYLIFSTILLPNKL
jgi:hypothetical protein